MGCTSSQSADVVATNTDNAPLARVQSARVDIQNANIVNNAPVNDDNTVKVQSVSDTRATSPRTPKYKLTYFDLAGRAEITRLLFAAGNIEYEDCRISLEQWPEHKNKTPLGQMPTLEIVNQPTLVQSLAIARYIAKEAGLYGSNNLEAAKIDSVVDTAVELGQEYVKQLMPVIKGAIDNKEEVLSKFLADVIPIQLRKLEKLLESYGEEDYFVGNKLSMADLFVYEILANLLVLYPKLLDSNMNN